MGSRTSEHAGGPAVVGRGPLDTPHPQTGNVATAEASCLGQCGGAHAFRGFCSNSYIWHSVPSAGDKALLADDAPPKRPPPPPEWRPCGGGLPWEQGQLAEGPLAPGGWASRGGHPWLPAVLALAPGRMQSQAGGAAPFSGCRQVPPCPGQPRVSEGSGNPHGSCSELRTPSGRMGTSEREE